MVNKTCKTTNYRSIRKELGSSVKKVHAYKTITH